MHYLHILKWYFLGKYIWSLESGCLRLCFKHYLPIKHPNLLSRIVRLHHDFPNNLITNCYMGWQQRNGITCLNSEQSVLRRKSLGQGRKEISCFISWCLMCFMFMSHHFMMTQSTLMLQPSAWSQALAGVTALVIAHGYPWLHHLMFWSF